MHNHSCWAYITPENPVRALKSPHPFPTYGRRVLLAQLKPSLSSVPGSSAWSRLWDTEMPQRARRPDTWLIVGQNFLHPPEASGQDRGQPGVPEAAPYAFRAQPVPCCQPGPTHSEGLPQRCGKRTPRSVGMLTEHWAARGQSHQSHAHPNTATHLGYMQ